MSIGAFTDKEHQPTAREILARVRPKQEAWMKLVQSIRENYSPREEFKFYGKSFGWAVRFRKGGKALVSLYPADRNFTVQIILSGTNARKALGLNLDKRIRQIIAKAHPYPEGRWLFIPVRSQKDVRNIHRLLALKYGVGRSQTKTVSASAKQVNASR